MKNKVLFLFILTFFVILKVIQAAGTTTPSGATTPSTTTPTQSTSSSGASAFTELNMKLLEEYAKYAKPSKAFTAVILVYFGLIVIGAILVLVLVKPVIEN